MKQRMRLLQLQKKHNRYMIYRQKARIAEVVETFHRLQRQPGELKKWLRSIERIRTYTKTMNMETGQWEE